MTKHSNERVEELDELDMIARTAARQSGHSHVIAQLPALSSNGRVCYSCVLGHVDSFLVTSALTSSAEKKFSVQLSNTHGNDTVGLHHPREPQIKAVRLLIRPWSQRRNRYILGLAVTNEAKSWFFPRRGTKSNHHHACVAKPGESSEKCWHGLSNSYLWNGPIAKPKTQHS